MLAAFADGISGGCDRWIVGDSLITVIETEKRRERAGALGWDIQQQVDVGRVRGLEKIDPDFLADREPSQRHRIDLGHVAP